MIRIRENAWCCGAGRGTKVAFNDFALWTAEERLEEVREVGAEAIVATCPHCKGNFTEAIDAKGDKIKVYDIAELISEAISK
jgi:Fe-S oxidoreductase